MSEDILVIGAGIAGLNTALALAPHGHRLVLLERDAAPPSSDPDHAFFDWSRRGVGHLRHSHAFLARLRTIIKDHHPALLEQLLAAGCREIRFADMLPDALKAAYAPEPGDQDMAVLTSRRTTLELVMRRYVEQLPGVSVVSDVFVRGLLLEPMEAGQFRVAGVKGEVGGEAHEWRAAVTIDAAGRNSQAFEQLQEAGAAVGEEAEDCGILYYTRHYRRLPDRPEPQSKAPGTGDLAFIKYGLFPGDNGCFSITLAVPEVETGIRQAIVRPEVFDKVCGLLPGLAPWADAENAEPISKVFGMGDLKSRWRSFVSSEGRATLGFFAVGDSLVRTNPLYGRGCSFAAVEAQILAGVLEQATDPGVRARLYDTRVRDELTVYYDDMRSQDRAAVRRALRARDPDFAPTLQQRLRQSFIDDGVRIAVRSDIHLLRAAMRDFHMIDPPGAWMKRPRHMAKVVGSWARGKKRNAHLYPPPLGPDRRSMLSALGIAEA
ncbi:NAD(P)/FAD-dependent oxidoreductase [Phenylobacterium montanum]|uniref:FAD-binding protein n=1 Tax=Phenylobacterium montanum TaxID=2823693 RepID=A0A975G023_9CAUL|nr:FAD-dependent oxidoreductase [Caulobacter sp. S6]QUD88072.1 FAD-binding protein [Caulobacter sp. S6]